MTFALETDSKSPTPKPKPGDLTGHRAPLHALTGIRFFAAVYVVLYHSHLPVALEQRGFSFVAHVLENGLLAVPLFFMLSGMILSYTYQGQISKSGAYLRFWEARIARVWPLYLISLLLSTAIDHTTPHSLWAVLATLFMVQSWDPFNPGLAASWNFVCWTLSVEAFFYLVFPPLQERMERLRTRGLVLVFFVLVVIAVGGATGSISYAHLHGLPYIPLALAHVPEFMLGMCVGNCFLRKACWHAGNSFPGRGAITIALVAASIWLLSYPTLGAAAWTGLTFPLLLFFLAAEKSPIQLLLSTRTAVIAGQISFGVYLLQWPCKTAISELSERLGIVALETRFTIYLVGLSLVSAAGFYLVEEPSRRLLRKAFASRRKVASRDARRPARTISTL